MSQSEPKASSRAMSVPSFKVMDVLRQANEIQARGHNVIHCEAGQPETGAPSLVASAAIESLSRMNVMGYTDAFGLLPLREKIKEHYMTKYNVDVDAKKIVVTTGSSGGFLLAFTAAFDVGDCVAVASCGYPCYRNILNALGVQLVSVSINSEFKLTAKELKVEIDRRQNLGLEKIRGIILSSPSNPTGAMLTPKELRDLCELCDENGIQFMSDEIYHGISYGKEEATALSFSNKAIIINSFSKYYSMPGWRLGWMVIPDHLLDVINSLQQNMFINAPTISQVAALKCWEKETIEELEQHIEKYRKSRTIILQELMQVKEIHYSNISPADGGFYIYVDLGNSNIAPGKGSVEMCKALLEQEYVAFTPGVDFEDPNGSFGRRRFRISYAGGIDSASEALKRFRRFWPNWLASLKDSQS